MSSRSYTDVRRRAWDDSGPRPLTTTIWYPTDVSSDVDSLTIGLPGRPPVFFSGLVVRQAPIRPGGRLPLILLSHGTGGSALQLAWLGTALAQHGYLVAAVNHHGNTAAEPAYDPRGFLLWWERARDLSAVLDQLLTDSLFGGRIDTTRIGAAGFSLGGYTVLALAGGITDLEGFQGFCAGPDHDATCDPQPEMPDAPDLVERLRATDPLAQRSFASAGASYRDRRIRAIVGLAPAVVRSFTEPSLRQIAIPALLIGAASDPIAPPKTNAQHAADLIPGAEYLLLPGATHYTFLSECTAQGRRVLADLCRDPGNTERGLVHAEVAARVSRYFDTQLGTAQ